MYNQGALQASATCTCAAVQLRLKTHPAAGAEGVDGGAAFCACGERAAAVEGTPLLPKPPKEELRAPDELVVGPEYTIAITRHMCAIKIRLCRNSGRLMSTSHSLT